VLIRTPLDVEKNLGGEDISVVMATPLTDRQIYLGAALPNFVRSVELIETLVILSFGAFIPFYILTAIPVAVAELPIHGAIPALLFIIPIFILLIGFVTITMILILLLFALASAMYAILTRGGIAAIFLTLIHYWFVSIVSFYASWIVMTLLSLTMIGIFLLETVLPGIGGISSLVILDLVKKAFFIVGTVLTGYIGINVMSNGRREGYYMPMNATASTIKTVKRSGSEGETGEDVG